MTNRNSEKCAYLNRTRNDPTWFLQRQLRSRPWQKQIDIIHSARDNKRTSVAGCVASSKTVAAAMLTHWFLNAYHPSKVFTLAPVFRQVAVNIWPEIHSLYRRYAVPLGGRLLDTELKLDSDWFAMGLSTDDPNYIQGIHGTNVLFIVDEAQGVDQKIWPAIENVLAGGNARLVLLMNPLTLSGEAYESFHSKRSYYNCIKIAAEDTPNLREGRVVIPGMITREQVDEWKAIYGPDSNFVRTKVNALFPLQEPDTLIPLDWIEQAWNREGKRGQCVLGVDVARFGDDSSVIVPVEGNCVGKSVVLNKFDTMAVVGFVKRVKDELKASQVYIDVIGIGSGVMDRLREMGEPAYGINVAEKAGDEERFADLRSELWWNVRELLNPDNKAIAIHLERDDALAAELTSVKYEVKSGGRIQIESKQDMKRRLGRSPDRADALCLALSGRLRNRKPVAAMSVGNFFTGTRNPMPSWA